jgi:hypothetical protein
VLAVADVGHADDDVLRVAECGREEQQERGRANFWREMGACNAVIRTRNTHFDSHLIAAGVVQADAPAPPDFAYDSCKLTIVDIH